MRFGRPAWRALPACAALLCGCANPGPPSPPSLMLPQPAIDLQAQRVGDGVTLKWTMPSRSTDRVALKGNQRVEVCRAPESGPCATVATLLLAPGSAAEYCDALPSLLRTGPLRPLRYAVRVENRRGAAVGASNPAFSAGGAAPPAVGSASAAATASGIVVRWEAAASPGQPIAGERLFVRLTREPVQNPGETPQTLEAPEHWDGNTWRPAYTVDAAAPLKGSYRYQVELVASATLGTQPVEVVGAGGETPVISARDVFPPAVPEGLQAVANAEGRSIDLSWNPSGSPDTLGYFVYRRAAGSAGAPERISGKAPVSAPGWSDRTPAPGAPYAYSVSAVDTSGNESARSPEAIESLPQQP